MLPLVVRDGRLSQEPNQAHACCITSQHFTFSYSLNQERKEEHICCRANQDNTMESEHFVTPLQLNNAARFYLQHFNFTADLIQIDLFVLLSCNT